MEYLTQNPQIIGIGASVFTGIALLPQLIKLLKEKKPGDIAIGMILILFVGLILWIIYGIIKKDMIIVVSNSFSLLINILILVFSILYKIQKR